MARAACVVAWQGDPAVKGAQTLKPVTCRDRILELESLVTAVWLGRTLTEEQMQDVVDICGINRRE